MQNSLSYKKFRAQKKEKLKRKIKEKKNLKKKKKKKKNLKKIQQNPVPYKQYVGNIVSEDCHLE